MKVYALVFCFGAGMLQNAMERVAGHISHMRLWIFWLVNVTAVAATIAEIIISFRTFRWWGLLISYLFFGIPDFIGRRWGNNPAPFYYLGLLASVAATVLIIWY